VDTVSESPFCQILAEKARHPSLSFSSIGAHPRIFFPQAIAICSPGADSDFLFLFLGLLGPLFLSFAVFVIKYTFFPPHQGLSIPLQFFSMEMFLSPVCLVSFFCWFLFGGFCAFSWA